MLRQSGPLLLRELHAAPIRITRIVLLAKPNPEWLVQRRFLVGKMRLKFDGVGSGLLRRVDESMGCAQRTVVRLRNFRNQKRRRMGTDLSRADCDGSHFRSLR